MARRFLLGACLAAFGLLAAGPAPAAGDCPQPRFTGRAPDAYYNRANPVPESADLSQARRTYLGSGGKMACATCHGAKGDGRGEMADQFDPRPRNFACAQTVKGIPDGQLFWIIRFGSPGTSMPPHPTLSDDRVWELVHFLRHLAR
jgi:mono/diheme cytochrome c family protein